MHLNDAGDPVWRDGDVVRVRFKRKRTDDLSEAYEYVRSDGHWPGEAFWSTHTDHEMTAAWHEDRLSVMHLVEVSLNQDECSCTVDGSHVPDPGCPVHGWPGQRIEPGVNGIWVAYHLLTDDDLRVPDGISFVLDGCVLFLDELAAYRFAAQQRPVLWTVGFVTWGTPLAETYPST